MEIDPKTAFATREHMGQKFYFCSADCAGKFDADPHRYSMATSATTGYNAKIPLEKINLPIQGLKKEDDATGLQSRLQAFPGISQVVINRATGTAQVSYDPGQLKVADLVKEIHSAGFHSGGAQTRIGIQDLRCASCVGFIENELRATPGVLSATVNVATQEASIEYLPEKTKLADLNTAIETWGYKTRPPASEQSQDKQQAEHHISGSPRRSLCR
jgi:Cu+-exporting ATPase